MPTKLTPVVGRLLHLECLRRSFIHELAAREGLAWECIPVLRHIQRFPGCIQADLSNAMKVTAAAVTQSTKKLEAQGMIEKKTDEDNLRIKRLYITPAGCALLDRGTELFDMTDSVMFDGFSDEDIETLSSLIDRINKNLETKKEENKAAKCRAQ